MLLYNRNQHNIAKQLTSNLNAKKKKSQIGAQTREEVTAVFNVVYLSLWGLASQVAVFSHEIPGSLGSSLWSFSGLSLLGNSGSHRYFLSSLPHLHNLHV